MEGSPFKHKRTAAQDILNKNLAQSIDLGLHRYSLGTDYSGPLTLRVTHIHSSSQDEQSSTHAPKPINSMKKSSIRQSKNVINNLKMNLLNLQEKISQAHRELQASPNKRSTIGGRPGQFEKILELFVCSQVSEDESTINLESHKLLKMKSKGEFFSKQNPKYYISHLLKSLSVPSDTAINHVQQLIQSMKTAMLLKIPSQIDIQPHKITLSTPSLDKKKTILIELNGVLINKRNMKHEEQDIQVGRGSSKFFVGLRPYLFSFLKKIRQSFEVAIFTILDKKIAEEIIDQIDPDRKLISDIITREKCLIIKDSFLCKDLRIINRNARDICLIDCNSESSLLNTDNMIPIIPFGSGQDRQLMQLQKFLLREILPCKDVRQILRDRFKLSRYWQYDRWQLLVRELYLD